MLKREWDAESKRKLPHLFIPSKTATYVPEFGQNCLGAWVCSEGPALGQNTDGGDDDVPTSIVVS